MIDFPKSTVVGRKIKKEAFYNHMSIPSSLKDRFISDVDSFVVECSLKKDNLNLEKDSDIKEIMLLSVRLKKQSYEKKILEEIARQNPHKLVFLVEYENERQLAIYQGKLRTTEWMAETDVNLSLHGDTLDEIWDDLVRQIAVTDEAVLKKDDETVEEQLALQDEIDKLSKLIRKTEKEAWKEQQPKKKFEIYTRLEEYKKQKDNLLNGRTEGKE